MNNLKNMKMSSKVSIFGIGVILLGLISCNNESSSEQSSPVESATSSPAPANITVPPPAAIGTPPVNTPATSSTVTYPASNTGQFLNASGTTAPGMNPPHGQPGHDCAIAVGAPLSGSVAAPAPAPAPAPAQVQVSTPVQTNPLPAPIPNLNANAKINPAHGQPGHDCAVAVGAPLPGK